LSSVLFFGEAASAQRRSDDAMPIDDYDFYTTAFMLCSACIGVFWHLVATKQLGWNSWSVFDGFGGGASEFEQLGYCTALDVCHTCRKWKQRKKDPLYIRISIS
jgi:hypothetical protein